MADERSPDPLTRPSMSYGTFAALGVLTPLVVWIAADTRVVSDPLVAGAALVVMLVLAASSARRAWARVPAGTWQPAAPVSTVRSVANGAFLFLLPAAISVGLCLLAQSLGGLGLLLVFSASGAGTAVALAVAERRRGVLLVEDGTAQDAYVAVRR